MVRHQVMTTVSARVTTQVQGECNAGLTCRTHVVSVVNPVVFEIP